MAESVPLSLATHGVMIAEHTTEITFGDTLGPEQKEMYEAELRKMLAEKLGNVADVVFFDHNLRCSSP